MQPYEVLGVSGMLFAGVAAIIQYIGSKDSEKDRGACGLIALCMGLLFAYLSYRRAVDDGFVQGPPISLSRCHAVIMTSF